MKLKYIKHESAHEWILYTGVFNFKELGQERYMKFLNQGEHLMKQKIMDF